MKMKLRTLALGSAASMALLCGGAFAADLPVRSAAPAPVVMAPIFTWNGFYVGINAGATIGDSTVSAIPTGTFLTDPAAVQYVAMYTSSAGSDDTGFTGGVTLGYNWQAGSFVFGVEADVNFRDNDSTTRFTTLAIPPVLNNVNKVFATGGDWFGTARARLGFSAGRALFYVTGGLAFGDSSARVAYDNDLIGAGAYAWAGSNSDTRFGWTLGGGLEYAFTNNWSLKAEYLYVDLGSETFTLVNAPANPIQGFTMRATYDDRFHVVRAGLNYRFGGGYSAPVVARY